MEEITHENKKSKGKTWAGLPFSQIIKKPYFYCALICIFITGMVLQGITGIFAPLLRDAGLNDNYIALVLSVHSLTLTFFKIAFGVFYDKFGFRKTVNICYVTTVIIMFVLSMVTNSYMVMVLAMFFGIFSSLALPLETIMLPICTGELFGEISYHKVLGIVVALNSVGYAVGAPLANLSYDLFGTYAPALYISSGLMIITIVIMNIVIKYARREKEKIKYVRDC